MDASNSNTGQPPRQLQREKLLVLIHHNERGPWLECYGSKHVDVHVRNVPNCGTGASGEVLAEDFIRHTLKPVYRDLYEANLLRATEVIREVRPSDIVDAMHQRAILRGLDSLINCGNSAVATTQRRAS